MEPGSKGKTKQGMHHVVRQVRSGPNEQGEWCVEWVCRNNTAHAVPVTPGAFPARLCDKCHSVLLTLAEPQKPKEDKQCQVASMGGVRRCVVDASFELKVTQPRNRVELYTQRGETLIIEEAVRVCRYHTWSWIERLTRDHESVKVRAL